MNFDGKAFVINQDIETFYSDNGSAIVMPIANQEFSTNKDNIFNNTVFVGESNANLTEDDFYNRPVRLYQFALTTHIGPKIGEVPFTAQVYTEKTTKFDNKLNSFTKVYIIDRHTKNKWISNSETRVQIHDIYISTNLFIINQDSAFIIDCTKNINEKEFPITYTNIVDKTEIIIPSPTKGYQDMFLVIQKNSFIEFKLSDTIINITGLPEGLEYGLNAIKGVILKSGSYDIRIQYQENYQKLNIVVPYYERTL